LAHRRGETPEKLLANWLNGSRSRVSEALADGGMDHVADALTARAQEIVGVDRSMLEKEGPEALTMRRLADRLGIRAPSLYKHFPHKAALEVAIIIDGFEEAAAAFEAAEREAASETTDLLQAFVATYRAFAKSHSHVYRLMTERPLPREQLPVGLEARTAAPLLRATGDPVRARAAWAFIHGLTMLELNDRLPSDDLTEPAWQVGVQQFTAHMPARTTH
jgi:AcrR family transcriptional regulator